MRWPVCRPALRLIRMPTISVVLLRPIRPIRWEELRVGIGAVKRHKRPLYCRFERSAFKRAERNLAGTFILRWAEDSSLRLGPREDGLTILSKPNAMSVAAKKTNPVMSFEALAQITPTRPFGWYRFIETRRRIYMLASLLLLFVCVFVPLVYSLSQLHNEYTFDRIRPNQIALYFGALVVVAFVRYTYVLHKLWDESKWLARYGQLGEANLLWVIRGKQRMIVTYRFWTARGVEVMREAVIDEDGPGHLTPLAAGDVVPVMYDPRNPKQRNMLWAEIERYVHAIPRRDGSRLWHRDRTTVTHHRPVSAMEIGGEKVTVDDGNLGLTRPRSRKREGL
jgi:hypothetical protein